MSDTAVVRDAHKNASLALACMKSWQCASHSPGHSLVFAPIWAKGGEVSSGGQGLS
jgi:hypothetical protein